MLPLRIRLSDCANLLKLSKKSISTSACLAGKVYRSKRKRKLINTYKVRDKLLRVEEAQPEDIPLLTKFMSEIAVKYEPSSRSTGTTASEFCPFVESNVTSGIRYTIIVMDEDKVVAAGIANCITLDRSKATEPKIREDYGELIDSFKEWIPSRNMRQAVAPVYDTAHMAIHFLPSDAEKVLRYDLCCVHGSVFGGKLLKKLVYERAMLGLRDGIKYGTTQTSACASYHTHTRAGSKEVFMVPYEKMLDHGKRIHKNVPLYDGSPGVTLFVFDLESLKKHAKC